jgi:hypothetical protein
MSRPIGSKNKKPVHDYCIKVRVTNAEYVNLLRLAVSAKLSMSKVVRNALLKELTERGI